MERSQNKVKHSELTHVYAQPLKQLHAFGLLLRLFSQPCN